LPPRPISRKGAPLTDHARKIPPAWLLGLANLPLGWAGGVTLLTIPQLLAARHVPEPVIAQLTTLALLPTFGIFLLGPIVDVRFSRRTYAAIGTALAAAATGVAILKYDNLALLGAAMFLALGGAAFNGLAIGGWFGSLLPKASDRQLGAWMVVANIGGFGLVTVAGVQLVRALPLPIAAGLLAAPNLAPLLLYAVTPAPGPDQRLAGETFARFLGDLTVLVRRPMVLQLVVLFAVPAASFALTNTLGGLGRDYHASERFVAIMGGAAVTAAGLLGSLVIPPLARRAPTRTLYITVGVVGAMFTLGLIGLPRTPMVFALAIVGQNVAQSAALALNYVIALESLGQDNPLAATQFGLITSAAALPITYMQLLDGHAYGVGGLTLMYAADGGLGLMACLAMAFLLRLWSHRRAAHAARA
jgi:PAT family beta-lactamase induction signal transducer AmpG